MARPLRRMATVLLPLLNSVAALLPTTASQLSPSQDWQSEPPQLACTLPRDRGPCSNFTRRWHFDTELGTCESFYHGGCDGNSNSFETLSECQRVCVKPAGAGTCWQPAVGGSCQERIQRWAYDPSVAACRPFVYGGCFGTSNRFASLSACEALCVRDRRSSRARCYQPARLVGECEEYVVRYSYVSEHDQCAPFFYGGCGGSSNSFASMASCRRRCVLHLSEDEISEKVGAGNATAEEVLVFTTSTEADACSLPRDSGDCEVYAPMFYYDTITAGCYQFIYNGCNGNANRFHTKQECENRCGEAKGSVTEQNKSGATTTEVFPTSTETPLNVSMSDPGKTHTFPDQHTSEGHVHSTTSTPSLASEKPAKQENQTKGGAATELASEPTVYPLPSVQPSSPGTARPKNRLSIYRLRRLRMLGRSNFSSSNSSVTASPLSPRARRDRRCRGAPQQGPCRRYLPRFYYNSELNSCYKFIYGGCLGSLNRFRRQRACERTCKN